jgi:hypothetical protein
MDDLTTGSVTLWKEIFVGNNYDNSNISKQMP